MKKILFVINTLGTAGAEKALIELLKHIDSRKYEVSLFVLMNQGELINEVPHNVKILNINYDQCSIHGKEGKRHLKSYVIKGLLKKFTFIKCMPYMCSNLILMIIQGSVKVDKLLWRAMAMSATKVNEKYDIAIAYIEGGATYYVNDYVCADKKIAFVHIDYKEAGYTRKLDQDCYLNFDRIYTVSNEVRDVFNTVYPEIVDKTSIFSNIISAPDIRMKSNAAGGFADSFDGRKILTVGRLNKQKAFEVSIDAARILRDKGYKFKWYILGEGDQRRILEKKISEMKLEESFILLGNKENPYPFYKQCDLYVHASKFEGKSIAIQEARILGCPIVVSDCSGNREQVLHDYDGIICDFSASSIASSIEYMFENPEKAKQMGENAAKRIAIEENNHQIDFLK